MIRKFKESRALWLFLTLLTLIPVLIAHYFLQNYLYMRPCEQCVYIRFDMLLVSFGAFLGFLNPNKRFLKCLAFIFAFYGCYLGLEHSFILEKIYTSVKSENPFGVSPCKLNPTFPFNLPLQEYFSEWFMPSGECGNDKAFVPQGAVLSPLQEFFIGQSPYFENGIYSKGWYLIPYFNFLNLAQTCILIFSFVFVCFLCLFAIFIVNFKK